MAEKDQKNIEHYLEHNPFVDDYTEPEIFYGTDFGLRFNANFHFNKPIQIIRFLYGLEKFGIFMIEIKKSGSDTLYKVKEFSFMRAVCMGCIQDEKNKKEMNKTFNSNLHSVLSYIILFSNKDNVVKMAKEYFELVNEDNISHILNNWMFNVESVDPTHTKEVFIPVELRRKIKDSHIYYNELYRIGNVQLFPSVYPNIHKNLYADETLEGTVKNSLGTFPVNKFKLFVDVKLNGKHWVYFVGYMGLVPVNQSVSDVAFSIDGQFKRDRKSLETFFDRFTRIFTNLYPDDIQKLTEKIQKEISGQ